MPIDYRKYPADWKTRIVPAITRRSGNQCEECGLSNGEQVYSVQVKKRKGKKTIYRRIWLPLLGALEHKSLKVVTVVLTVAHIDNDAHNHKVDLSRLKHLCQRCHLKADAYYKAIKRQCGYYCDSPLCSNISCIHKTPKPCQQAHTPASYTAPSA